MLSYPGNQRRDRRKARNYVFPPYNNHQFYHLAEDRGRMASRYHEILGPMHSISCGWGMGVNILDFHLALAWFLRESHTCRHPRLLFEWIPFQLHMCCCAISPKEKFDIHSCEKLQARLWQVFAPQRQAHLWHEPMDPDSFVPWCTINRLTGD